MLIITYSETEAQDKKTAGMQGSAKSESSLKTRLAFHLWLALLLISLGTFALGISGHIVTLIAAPWLSLRTQATIHATIPLILTTVKFVTVPLLLLLTPFSRLHATFKSWTRWSKANLRKLEGVAKIPWNLAIRVRSAWLRRKEGY